MSSSKVLCFSILLAANIALAQVKISAASFPSYLGDNFDYSTFTRIDVSGPPKSLIYQSNGFMALQALRLPSELRDAKIHQRILSLTEGVLGRVCKLIETAAIEAIRSGEERIALALLNDDLVTESLVSIKDRRNRRFSGS